MNKPLLCVLMTKQPRPSTRTNAFINHVRYDNVEAVQRVLSGNDAEGPEIVCEVRLPGAAYFTLNRRR